MNEVDREGVVLVTGASGMVGSAVCRHLKKDNFRNILAPSRSELDLTDKKLVFAYFEEYRPDYVFMIAAKVGGIAANIADPVGFLTTNLKIQNNLFEACYKFGTRKNLFLGCSCVYPSQCPQPIKEEYLLAGSLEETNEGFAIAKIAGLKMAQYYNRQHGMATICPIPSNIYGNNDSFDIQKSHVVAAFVRRFVEAKINNFNDVTLWGTGIAARDFIHVEDVARALCFLMNQYDSSNVINVSTGATIKIRDLARLVAEEVGYEGNIIWDPSKPDGMLLKSLNNTVLSSLGFATKISLQQGITSVVQEYNQLRAS